MLEDLRSVLQLPACDLFVIIDDSNTTGSFNASKGKNIGKQRIEILTTGVAEAADNAASGPGQFTKLLTEALSNLLKASPRGFPISRLYREIYQESPDAEPQLFNLSSGHHSEISICQPITSGKPRETKTKGELVLNLSLHITGPQVETSMMNDIASHLQFLPHVKAIKFLNLSAPSEEIAKFMQSILRAQKLRPLVRKLHARRQMREIQSSSQPSDNRPQSLFELQNRLNQNPRYDWSNVTQEHPHKSSDESISPPPKKRRISDWP